VRDASATSFPLSKHTGGGDTAHTFSGLCVYLQFTWKVGLSPLLWSFPPTAAFTSFPAPDYWVVLLLLLAGMVVYSSRGRWVFPPLLLGFPPSTTLTSFPTSGCWVCTAAPALSGQPGLFIYSSGRGSPSTLFRAQGTPPSLPHVFIVLIAHYSVSLFSPGGGWSVQGAMLIWPRVVCGSTMYPLAHLVCVFPSHLGAGVWQSGSPPGFSVQCKVEMLCTGWRCGGVKVLPLFGGLACTVCLQHLSKISLKEARFLLPPSSRHLGIH
jgi:hypothetical protein